MELLEARLRDKETEHSRLEERLRHVESEVNAGNEQHQALQNEVSTLSHDKQVGFLFLLYVQCVFLSLYSGQ